MAERLPYIISEDAEHLVDVWGKRKGLATPDHGFFKDFQDGLVEHISAAGPDYHPVILNHQQLAHSLNSLLFNHIRGDAVALDKAYVGDRFARHLEVTRAVDEQLESIGTKPRPHSSSIDEQLDYIVANSGKEVTLVDDVIFSGDAIIEAAKMFAKRGVRVSTVLAAVAIGEGYKKIEEAGIEVIAVADYDEVKDEICERDFLAGIPYSGRTVYRDDGEHYSAPYFSPFGRPESWASISNPAAAHKLSVYCLDRSIELWKTIERLNGNKPIAHHDIPRPLSITTEDEGIVDFLNRAKALL